MRCFLFLISLTLFSPVDFSLAQTANCANPQATLEMKICAQIAYEVADGDLNTNYKIARNYMRTLDQYLPDYLKGAENALLKAQRIWIKIRDADCNLEGFNARGGTLEGLIIISCLERKTRSRSGFLRNLFEQN